MCGAVAAYGDSNSNTFYGTGAANSNGGFKPALILLRTMSEMNSARSAAHAIGAHKGSLQTFRTKIGRVEVVFGPVCLS